MQSSIKYQSTAWLSSANLYSPNYRQAHFRVFEEKYWKNGGEEAFEIAYNDIKSDKVKRQKLKAYINKKRTAVRNLVLDKQRLDHGLSEEEQNRRDKVTYLNKVPQKNKVLIEETYKYENDGRTIAEDDAWEYALTQAKRLKDGGID